MWGRWDKEKRWGQARLRSLSLGPVVVELLSAGGPEPDVGVRWVLALTLRREESREPVSRRKAFDEITLRGGGEFGFLVG